MPNRISEKTGSELFIVDNSDYEWKVVRYLHDWCELSKAIDIATGFFEIGALLSLDGEWQKVDKIRILMGDVVSLRTKKAFEEGIGNIVKKLDASIEKIKDKNPFLTGAPAIVEALRTGKIQCKVYRKEMFHAKAYITHARKDVIGAAALVGSSNFTYPGLHENIELNVQITGGQVAVLQEWYEEHWNSENAEDVTPEILRTFEKHTRDYTPFEVYTRALQELFEHHTPSDAEWERLESKMYPKLSEYQREGYHSLLKISKQYNGAFLCDGVGLGKTFVGLMLLERMVMRDKKRVVLIVPKSGRVPVWESHIRKYLPHLLNGFLPFKIYNHTDLMRGISADERDYPAEFEQIKAQADVVIIDEAHNFRNRGLYTTEDGEIRSRYWKLYDVIDKKQVFLLTATPVNNALTDFRHQIELFTREERAVFAGSLGIHNLQSYFQQLEKALKDVVSGQEHGELFQVNQAEAEKIFFEDKLFREIVVQRSRAYAKESQRQEGVSEVIFPEKAPPAIQPYSVTKTYGKLLGMVEAAFSKTEQLFNLAVYYPLAKWKDPKTKPPEWNINTQRQIVKLIRIQFLKRFESSIFAFESSCQTLLLKLLAFLRKNIQTESEIDRLKKWEAKSVSILEDIKKHKAELQDEEDSEEMENSDLGAEFLEDFEVLSREDYRVDEIFEETYEDLDQLVTFLEEIEKFDVSRDNKLQSLIKLLTSNAVLKKHKVLIFSEYMTTARYLKRELIKAGIEGVDEVDSSSSADRGDTIKRFAPYYNESSSKRLKEDGLKEIRVLISTDVLSEGLNLQDATRLINYDLHWNPVRLMQRIGRIDRRLNPEIEEKMIEDHPDQKKLRGDVAYWNFLPPDDLDILLRLYTRVSSKTLRISKVFGIEGKKLLHPEDDYEALKDFNHTYEGVMTDLEKMHLEYQKLLAEDSGLQARLDYQPETVFSGKEHPKQTAEALFLCYVLPAEDKAEAEQKGQEKAISWTEEAGKTAWYLYDLSTGKILEDPAAIVNFIRCKPDTLRRVVLDPEKLKEVRSKVDRHITNTYLKQVQAPIDVKPKLKCWMELS
jgi:ERCC4-related helicase